MTTTTTNDDKRRQTTNDDGIKVREVSFFLERKESRSEGGIVVIRVEGRKVEVEEREV